MMRGQNILGLEDMKVSDMERILDTAVQMKSVMKQDIKKLPSLRGKSIVNLFFENTGLKNVVIPGSLYGIMSISNA